MTLDFRFDARFCLRAGRRFSFGTRLCFRFSPLARRTFIPGAFFGEAQRFLHRLHLCFKRGARARFGLRPCACFRLGARTRFRFRAGAGFSFRFRLRFEFRFGFRRRARPCLGVRRGFCRHRGTYPRLGFGFGFGFGRRIRFDLRAGGVLRSRAGLLFGFRFRPRFGQCTRFRGRPGTRFNLLARFRFRCCEIGRAHV